MRQKALKCTVKLKIKVVTCPGVVLPSKESVYIRVGLMGQYQSTKRVPPVFPLYLDEKMVFVKTFSRSFDPGAVAELLQDDMTSLELVQLVPPDGEILARFEDDTRTFLYPGQRFAPRSSGRERGILMKRCVSFPGISPKVEFSTTSVIEECDVRRGLPDTSPCESSPLKPYVRSSPPAALEKKRRPQAAPPSGYKKPTVASLSRELSPYTHRRMCQLSDHARQRLAHLQLGPYAFKKETLPQPPFVFSRSPVSRWAEPPLCHPSPHASWKRQSPHTRGSTASVSDSSVVGSFRAAQIAAELDESAKVLDHRCIRTPSPVLGHTSLRERFSSSAPTHAEEIHRRVERILNTHGGGGRKLEADVRKSLRSSGVLHRDQTPPHRPDADADPDVRSFWRSRAAAFTGKPRGLVFEERLRDLYRNLYKTAAP